MLFIVYSSVPFNKEFIESYNEEYRDYINDSNTFSYVFILKEELVKNYNNFVFTDTEDEEKLTKEAFMFAKFLVEELNMSFKEYLEAVSTNVTEPGFAQMV